MNRASRLAALTAAVLLAGVGPATADGEDGDTPNEAGTAFRTATVIDQDQTATAVASAGDYLYWTFPVAAGQTATAEATVTLPDAATRTGPSTWRVDVYDGLRRRQACTEGEQVGTAAENAESVTLSCTVRTVRSWAEPWSDDPLPGAYYLRVTVSELPERDLGLPIDVEVAATVADAGGSADRGGDLATPLLPVGTAGTLATGDAGAGEDGGEEEGPQPYLAALPEPEDGWSGGWWTDRWLWTAGGGVLGGLACAGGYLLARPRRSSGA
ncbi:hypothetical protein [Streptomyces hainanensis]|uniref:Peptidase n=1 Tax=Streptomyces hainanensis TaxID=402648 RepID=A0A4R4T8V4_9ACTN|nr:hypothetical protein [Streptomyces hainanensis]TDC73477.1 hypothetical protein E1283_19110 [Streptomyces hainanensis]